MVKKFLPELNDEQLAAVKETEGYVRLLAGAGTGKTKCLTYRYAYLLTALGISPGSVLCVTFTNKAAEEMKTRILKLCGDIASPFVCTFHGFCCDFLRDEIKALGYTENFTVTDVQDVMDMLEPIYKELEINGREFTLKDGWDFIDIWKSDKLNYVDDMLCPDSAQLLIKSSEFAAAGHVKEAMFYRYLYAQRASSVLDFDDLIAFTLTILRRVDEVRERWQNRLEYIEVDEFQDIDKLQNELIETLSGGYHNLFIVGDPDQTIYSFRGADVKLFTQFDKVHPDAKCHYLKQNYRSQRFILDCAYTLISKNPKNGRVHLEAVRKDIDLDQMLPLEVPADNNPARSEALELLNRLQDKTLVKVESAEAPHFETVEGAKRSMKPALVYLPSKVSESRYIAECLASLLSFNERASCAVLYRARHVSRTLEHALIEAQIPYRVVADISFFERREIKDVMAYLRLCFNPEDDTAFRRCVNMPRRGFGRQRMQRLTELAASNGQSLFVTLCENTQDKSLCLPQVADFAQKVISVHAFIEKAASPADALEHVLNLFAYEEYLKSSGQKERLDSLGDLKRMTADFAVREGERTNLADFITRMALYYTREEDDGIRRVQLMTVHNAKGLEFDYVIVAGLNEGVFPSDKSNTFENLEEERRLLYVAMTRAKKQLIMTVPSGGADSASAPAPSRFVEDMREDELLILGDTQNRARPSKAMDDKAFGLFSEGDKVFHQIFGQGVIEDVNAKDGEYRVRFESLGKPRTLSFKAPLEKLS